MPDMPSAAGPQPSPFNRGPMTSVDGDYAPPVPGRPQGIPSSFGGNVDLASAFEGTLSDMRAVAQQTIKTLSDIGIMAQRVSSMLGGSANGSMAAPPVPNQVPQLFPSNTSSYNVTAAIAQATGAVYGTAANASPQYNPSYSLMPSDITNPAFASIPTNFGAGPTAQPVPPQVPPSPFDMPSPSGTPSWAPAAPSDQQRDADIARIKHLTEMVLGGEYIENTGGSQAGQMRQMATQPSVRGIMKNIAGRVQNKFPNWAASRPNTPWNANTPEAATARANAGAQLASGAMSSDDYEALQTAGFAAKTGGLGAGIGELAGGGDLVAAGGAALGGGAMAALGPVAMGVGAAYLGLKTVEEQRATNAAIQSQIGGSNFSAYGTRAQGLGYSLANLGTMSMGMSNQAFMGVTDLGLQGGARSNALSFVQQNYSNMGMSVADSLALVSASVKAGNQNLQQLATTLDAVTNSAANAAVNTEQARQNFTTMFQGAIGAGVSTTGAANLAGGAQMLTNALGLSGQGLQFGQAPIAAAAGIMGKSLPAYEAAIAADPTGQIAAQGQQAFMMHVLGPLGSGIKGLQGMADLAYKHQSGGQSKFAQALMKQGNITTQQMTGMLNAAGVNTQGVSLNGQWDALAGILSGKSNLPTAVAKSSAESAINAQINKLRPTGHDSWWGNPFHTSTLNHQFSGAEANVDRYISHHGVGAFGTGAAAALLAHGQKDRIQLPGLGQANAEGVRGIGTESVAAALGNRSTFNEVMSGHAQVQMANGKYESLSKWVTAHKTSLGPPSSTKGGSASKAAGTITVNLTPAASQLVQIATSGAAQIGNNYGTLNTPPTGITPFNPSS